MPRRAQCTPSTWQRRAGDGAASLTGGPLASTRASDESHFYLAAAGLVTPAGLTNAEADKGSLLNCAGFAALLCESFAA